MLISLVSCAASVGSSYTVEKQNLAVHFLAEPQAHLEIDALFQLVASGTRPPEAIEINLPDDKTCPIQDLRISLDGHSAPFKPSARLPNHSVRIQLDPPWQLKQRRNLVVQYTVPTVAPLYRKDATVSGARFVVGGNWYPLLLSPKGMFSKLLVKFNKWDLEIRAPEDFLVHASGRVRHSRRESGDVLLRIQHTTDGIPFIVAGRYKQQIITAALAHRENQIIFWTRNPLPTDAAYEAGMQIARLVGSYDRMFGTADASRRKSPDTIWIAECLSDGSPVAPVNSTADEAPEALCAASVPDTIFLDSHVWANGVTREVFQDAVNHGLAHLRLGHGNRLNKTQNDSSLSGLYAYAAHVVRSDPGPQSRQQGQSDQNNTSVRRNLIARYLEEYEKKLRHQAGPADRPDNRPDNSVHSPPKVQPSLEPSFEKSVLFLFALEDHFGSNNLQRAIARMVYALGEQGYNRNDLRAALEGETKKNASDFFRRWLDQPGIPEDFRARYQNKPGPQAFLWQNISLRLLARFGRDTATMLNHE